MAAAVVTAAVTVAVPADPWAGHDFGVLLTVLFCGTAVLAGLTAFLGSRLAPRARRRYTPARAWRDASLLAVAAGLALYLWGCLHVLFLEDGEQAARCERHRPPGLPALVGRRGDFLPLRLVCEVSDGRDYTVVVPGFVNPTLAVLLLLALLGALTAALLHRKQRTSTRHVHGAHGAHPEERPIR
ncbi:hypothetical protein [Streptomyces sp. NPDC059247]|uniref:hypothetical protein n=1 Tax=Streptomyces sp. NPDC059247 TaxID=3346790 RepID=UPI0036745E34